MSTRVYRYGLLRPTENLDLVRQQMRDAHRYRNALVEIERGRRAALREAMAELGNVSGQEAAVAAAEARLELAVTALRAERAVTRTRSETDATKAELKAAREARKVVVAALRERRRAAREDEALIARCDEINELAADLRRNAREHCGVYWGTYLLIEAEDQAARAAPLYDGAEPNDPAFVHWSGEGAVGVQLQGGMAATEVFTPDTRLRIDPVDDKAWLSDVRGERRRLSRTTLRMRVGSTGRDPIWAAWPMVMHRALPEGGVIKKATVSLRMIGPREEWSVAITVDTSAVLARTDGGKGVVAVDIGWRAMPDGGLRVAVWQGDDGATGEIRLSAQVLGGLHKPEELRSIRDTAMNAALKVLVERLRVLGMPVWMRDLTGSRGSHPTEAQALAYLAGWRSPVRLASLVLKWRDAKEPATPELCAVYETIEAWRYHDYHLWQWETSQRTGALRLRREVYRVAAAELARRYKTIVLEKFDLRAMAMKAPAEAPAENCVARSNRQVAATSELRLVLVNAFVARGGNEAHVPAQDSTRACPHCGLVTAFDAAASVTRTCDCGETMDQDASAAVVLLRRYSEQSGGEPGPWTARGGEEASDPAAVAESRWVKARRMAGEKAARRGTAR